ncbi:MAG: hypothetical protein C0412_20020 [Flavobacterium sp.]|nr:hypothetical protein [Flavobacterium sp.]
MKEFGYLNLLAPQVFTPEEETIAIQNTMTIDYAFGHKDIVTRFALGHPVFFEHCCWLKRLPKNELKKSIEEAKSKSLLMTMIMLTGFCNANCEICYTDRKKKSNELSFDEIKSIIDQTRALGSKTIYVAGEGEPTLDKNFFKVVDYIKSIDMRMLVFTNGILLSNDKLAQKSWGISSEEMAKRLSDAPVWIYHKFWSTKPKLVEHLMRLPSTIQYNYIDWNLDDGRTILIPEGIYLLFKHLPRERIGVEVVVEKRNADEVADLIVPFILQTGVKSYLEPIIHSGKNFCVHSYDPTAEQLTKLRPYLVRQKCTRVAYKFAVHNNGYATPGISILSNHLRLQERYEDLNIRIKNGLKDIFSLRHSHPFLVQNRYKIDGCLCEQFNLEMEKQHSYF